MRDRVERKRVKDQRQGRSREEEGDVRGGEKERVTGNLMITILQLSRPSCLSKVTYTAYNPVSVTSSAHVSAHCGLIFILNQDVLHLTSS